MRKTQKDNLYREVKILLELGQIKTFVEILHHLPVAILADDMKLKGTSLTKIKDMQNLIRKPSRFTIDQVFRLSELLECDSKKLLILAGKAAKNKK